MVTHFPGQDQRSEFSLFKLPEPEDIQEEAVEVVIASIKEELPEDARILSISTDPNGSHVLYLEERDTATDSNIVKKMEIGEYMLQGSGKVSTETLNNTGFKISGKTFPLNAFYTSSD